jgi:alanyl-tRNA synthetase
VKSTGEIGTLKIISESAVSKGRRRVECYVGKNAIVEILKKARKCDEIALQIGRNNNNVDVLEIHQRVYFLLLI